MYRPRLILACERTVVGIPVHCRAGPFGEWEARLVTKLNFSFHVRVESLHSGMAGARSGGLDDFSGESPNRIGAPAVGVFSNRRGLGADTYRIGCAGDADRT